MKYAIELYFDKETEKKLYHYAKRIAEEKISTKFLEWKTRPHLTLACLQEVDEPLCIERLKVFAQDHQAMPAFLGSVGMFTDTKTIFLSPVMNHSMYRFQRELYESFGDFDAGGFAWYCPDRWTPHCTVALTGEDNDDAFFQASDLLLHEFEKISGVFTEIGLVKITFPVEEIFTIHLS